METSGEDLRRLRHMKPLNNSSLGGQCMIPDLDGQIEYDEEYLVQQQQHEASYPFVQHKRRRHPAIRQPSGDNVSLMEELASSTSMDLDQPQPPMTPMTPPPLPHPNDKNNNSNTSNLVINTSTATSPMSTGWKSFEFRK